MTEAKREVKIGNLTFHDFRHPKPSATFATVERMVLCTVKGFEGQK